MPKTHPATRDEIIELLLAHRTLGGAPRPELEWLADHGTLPGLRGRRRIRRAHHGTDGDDHHLRGRWGGLRRARGREEEVHGVARGRRHGHAPVLEDEARSGRLEDGAARSSVSCFTATASASWNASVLS